MQVVNDKAYTLPIFLEEVYFRWEKMKKIMGGNEIKLLNFGEYIDLLKDNGWEIL